jgi:hypothetical protein
MAEKMDFISTGIHGEREVEFWGNERHRLVDGRIRIAVEFLEKPNQTFRPQTCRPHCISVLGQFLKDIPRSIVNEVPARHGAEAQAFKQRLELIRCDCFCASDACLQPQ